VADESQGVKITTETKDTPTITLEDLIPEPGESDEDDASQNWLDFKGKKIHKASVIRCLFSSELAKKSWEHLLRVRGYTRNFSPKTSLNCNDLTGEQFLVGDLAALLICSDKTIALAILQVTSIEQDKQCVSGVAEDSLRLSTVKTFVSGQILQMMPTATHDDDGNPTLPAMQQLLLWTGSYCKLAPLKRKKKSNSSAQTSTMSVSRKALIIRISGQTIHPLNLRIESTSHLPPTLWPIHSTETWAVSVIKLSAVVDALWELTELNQANSHVPKCGGDSDGFPYKLRDGTFFVSHGVVCTQADL
ncbi:hypothetical protein PAXRUDRAFT_164306, partial [Paxillus rubicundulus Ve08.2h10]